MPMASSWKLKTTLRWKKSLGSMPSLAEGVVYRGEQVGRPGQLELHDGHLEAGMTLEDAGEDQIAHRQRRIERLRRAGSVSEYARASTSPKKLCPA
jgi:hypothetical protein